MRLCPKIPSITGRGSHVSGRCVPRHGPHAMPRRLRTSFVTLYCVLTFKAVHTLHTLPHARNGTLSLMHSYTHTQAYNQQRTGAYTTQLPHPPHHCGRWPGAAISSQHRGLQQRGGIWHRATASAPRHQTGTARHECGRPTHDALYLCTHASAHSIGARAGKPQAVAEQDCGHVLRVWNKGRRQRHLGSAHYLQVRCSSLSAPRSKLAWAQLLRTCAANTSQCESGRHTQARGGGTRSGGSQPRWQWWWRRRRVAR